MKSKLIFLALATLCLALASCGGAHPADGTLSGKVDIGPITPVQGITPVPTPPSVYAARKVLVYDSSHSRLLDTVSLDDNGNYSIGLAPGTYVVDINHAGADRSSDVPKTILIQSYVVITLNISIDTGIR
jgi:hypothetical protein